MKFALTLALLTLWLTGCDRAPTTPPAEVKPKETAPAPSPTVDDKLPAALELKRAGKLAEARAALVELPASESTITALNEIDTQLLFTPAPAPQKTDYTV